MKVILRQNIESLGQIGEVLDVKDGYARNYLIPNKLAYVAVEGNLKTLNEEKRNFENKTKKEVADAENLASQLDKVTIEISVQVGEEGKLFGSVTTQMIADSLTEKSFSIDKRKIEIAEPIKQIGLYSVDVKLHQAVTAKVKVLVKEAEKE